MKKPTLEQMFQLGVAVDDIALAQKHVTISIVNGPGQWLANGQCAGRDADKVLQANDS
jgi:hypothetical protein